MNVVDIGCCSWGTETSIDRLIQRFHPERLYGFDPYPEVHDGQFDLDGCKVIVSSAAAWTTEGYVWIELNGSRTSVRGTKRLERFTKTVRCFDLAARLSEFSEPVILKMDAEGAEYVLIPHLIETGAIDNVELLLIEWHGEPLEVPCPWESWA